MPRKNFINIANCGRFLNPVYFFYTLNGGNIIHPGFVPTAWRRCGMFPVNRQGNIFFSKERKQWKKEKALEPILVS